MQGLTQHREMLRGEGCGNRRMGFECGLHTGATDLQFFSFLSFVSYKLRYRVLPLRVGVAYSQWSIEMLAIFFKRNKKENIHVKVENNHPNPI